MFFRPLIIFKCHLLNHIVYLILHFVHQGATNRRINSRLHQVSDSVVESLDDHPPLKSMMRTQSQLVIELLLSLIE